MIAETKNNSYPIGKFCPKCGAELIEEIYATGRYDYGTGLPIYWRRVGCPRIFNNRIFTFGHMYYYLDANGIMREI